MERFSDLLKGKFAFGCMRMQLDANGEVDLCNFREMVDRYLASGFNYFDTAHVYYEGKEVAATDLVAAASAQRRSFFLTVWHGLRQLLGM